MNSKNKKGFTLEEHKQNVEDIQTALRSLRAIALRGKNKYLKKHKLYKLLIDAFNGDCSLNKLRGALDEDFHSLVDDANFKKEGHIYYGLSDEEREILTDK